MIRLYSAPLVGDDMTRIRQCKHEKTNFSCLNNSSLLHLFLLLLLLLSLLLFLLPSVPKSVSLTNLRAATAKEAVDPLSISSIVRVSP